MKIITRPLFKILTLKWYYWFNWVLELIGTWLGLGVLTFETLGLGPGLDNNLTPTTNHISGILNQSTLTFISRGPK